MKTDRRTGAIDELDELDALVERLEKGAWTPRQASIEPQHNGVAPLEACPEEPKLPVSGKEISLARFVEVLGGALVPEDGAPAGWTVEQWAKRKPLGPGKGLRVTCQFCGNTVTNPKEGLAWAEKHECPEARPCSHCNGRGKNSKRQCGVCALQEHCCVCGGCGRVSKKEPPFDASQTRTTVKPIPIPCAYCGVIQESRRVYAQHLDGCEKNSKASRPTQKLKIGDRVWLEDLDGTLGLPPEADGAEGPAHGGVVIGIWRDGRVQVDLADGRFWEGSPSRLAKVRMGPAPVRFRKRSVR